MNSINQDTHSKGLAQKFNKGHFAVANNET